MTLLGRVNRSSLWCVAACITLLVLVVSERAERDAPSRRVTSSSVGTTVRPQAIAAPAAAPQVARSHTSPRDVPVGRVEPAAATVLSAEAKRTPKPVETRRPADLIVVDGQSFANSPSYERPVADRVFAARPDSTGKNVALNGTTYTERQTTATERVDRLGATSAPSVVIDVAGQSDLLDGMSAADVYAVAVTYKNGRERAGFDRYALCTVPHSTWYTPQQELERRAYNDLLRNSDEFDVVVDIAARPELSNGADPRYFDQDQMHPNPAGAAVIVEEILAAVW